MRITKSEMNFLCRIQELGKLPGFKMFPMMQKEESEKAKEGLLEKKILKNTEELSEEGLVFMTLIKLYAESKIYYRFGEAGVLGKYKDKEYIIVTSNDDSFDVETVNQDAVVASLLLQFKNIREVKDGSYRKKFIKEKDLLGYIEEREDSEAIFYYKVDLEAKKDTRGILFIDEGRMKRYKLETGELQMYPRDMIQRCIEEIFK